MSVAFSLPLWAIPAMLTVVILGAASLWPVPRRSGDYDFSPTLFGILHGVVALVATLALWLAFFIIV